MPTTPDPRNIDEWSLEEQDLQEALTQFVDTPLAYCDWLIGEDGLAPWQRKMVCDLEAQLRLNGALSLAEALQHAYNTGAPEQG